MREICIILLVIFSFLCNLSFVSCTIECAPPVFKTRRLSSFNAFISNDMTKSLSQSISIQQTSDQSKSKSKSKSTSLTSSLTEMERDLSSSGDDVHESPDHDTEGPQILYFFSVGLCLGAVTSFLLTKFKSNVPYSVVMFAEGMIAAVIFMHLDKFVDDTYPPLENIFDSIEDWGQINPVFLLYMFIPVLTFSDALKLPW